MRASEKPCFSGIARKGCANAAGLSGVVDTGSRDRTFLGRR
ncbi:MULTISPECIES: hypothetical protein [Xanthomonas]|nr:MULTISPECIES: hypothetical protein [Xanthomonas]